MLCIGGVEHKCAPDIPAADEGRMTRSITRFWESLRLITNQLLRKLLLLVLGSIHGDISPEILLAGWVKNWSPGQTPKAIGIKTKINEWILIKLTSFCTVREIISRTKRQPTEWEKYLHDETDKSIISKINKQLIQFNNKKTNNSIHKCVEDLKRQFSKKADGYRHMKRCSTFLIF